MFNLRVDMHLLFYHLVILQITSLITLLLFDLERPNSTGNTYNVQCTTKRLCLKSLPHKPQQNYHYCLIVQSDINADLTKIRPNIWVITFTQEHTNTWTVCIVKHVHLVGPTESQHSLLFYESYTQHDEHGTNVARERTHRIHGKRRHIWDFWGR